MKVVPRTYQDAWAELNGWLRHIEESGGGLPGALSELRREQKQSGFIKDGLEGVKRYTFSHPDDPRKFFRAQYNPKRALRFEGAGRSEPLPGFVSVNDGCFLCRDNICWQQHGAQIGYEIPLTLGLYYAWMNPFPLLPMHVVVASAEHRPQGWILRGSTAETASNLLADFLEIADRLPGYFGYFNGLDAGASIPGHLHFHFCQRPEGLTPFPLELAARRSERRDGEAGLIDNYPLSGTFWRGTRESIFGPAWGWIERWADDNSDRLQILSTNLIASKDQKDGTLSLYFIPRARGLPATNNGSEHIGGLEVLGEFVFSSPAEKPMLDQGVINYFVLEGRLSHLQTPLYAA